MSRLAVVIPFLVVACGGAEPPATKPAAPAAAPADFGDDLQAGCVQMFQRQRECTDVFIPALVAARVKHDKPAGIAAEDAASGRDALVAHAMEEWKADSTDEAIAATCEKIVASIPPEQKDAMVAKGKECLAADSCPAFVDCMLPVIEARFQ
jgi:hypothetical protein